jgi:STE24 endopeptidase
MLRRSVNEDRAARYHRLKRQAAVVSLLWPACLFAALLFTGATLHVRQAAESIAAIVNGGSGLVVIAYVGLLTVIVELGATPLAFYSGLVLERRYGLSAEPVRGWVRDHVKSLAISLLLGAAAAVILYALIRQFPQRWWLPAGVLFAFLTVGLAGAAPVLILPLFYRVKPLEREALRARLLGLAERAGARVLGAYEWGLGQKTRKANAALTGLGATRRILVSDTMLEEYSDEEIEVVLAHELAHHVHGDIWKGLAFESAMILGGFYAAARWLAAAAARLGLTGPDDVAGLPLLLVAVGGVLLAVRPAAHAMSRAYERSADRFALTMTKNPAAFISAMRRLSAQNLAEEHPSRVTQWLFYSHPPVRERIAAAQAFTPQR